ncbi:MAG: type I DNA topoisomerase [Rhodospirillales bacterium]|nr:type I DNA topoisomerase [Rhodospirillales bacterium]MBO6785949.1 type I DNA topoisomerase [Rhodospirillales bacterium]
MSSVVVVESPAKAKTINKYLGDDYTVLASYGHIRDLPSKNGSVEPDDDFAMKWEIDGRSKKHVDEIAKAVKKADALFLATDPDREGEAISWHIKEVLDDRKLLDGKAVKRVVFNEITKDAVQEAFEHPRELDHELVDAYMARRALDYLVGFTLSPVLWRKLPGSRSAGRVQSVALRLICERELEIEMFKPEEYWTVDATFRTPRGDEFKAALTRINGEKLDKFTINSEALASQATAAIENETFTTGQIERKQTRRYPSPPFTTSTMQQEASRKLYFGARKTMQVAQSLYEGVRIGGENVGLITYMRTDGVQMAREAVAASRNMIQENYGSKYLPDSPRIYKSKAKNAQEAHEAIRPTDVRRTPDSVAKFLNPDQLKLYTLIWKRTVASQMEAAVLDQVGVDISSGDSKITFRATGSVIAFDGFIKVYREGRDDGSDDDDSSRILPKLEENEAQERTETLPEQHFTQPPPRYSEASLVKKLEELGIGRPSTYASIISVLQDRNYVQIDKRRFIPEDRGRLVTTFLASFFERYVEYDFTAELEEKLDDISGGRIDWKQVLIDFWRAFKEKVDETQELRVRDVLNVLNEELKPHFFPERADGSDPRSCPKCKEGELSIKLGRHGAFLGCSRYPDCNFTTPLGADPAENSLGDGPKELGTDPETGKLVTLRQGPYGTYIQLGEEELDGKKKIKPKRASLPAGVNPDDMDMEKAIGLLSLPRFVGIDPVSGMEIRAGIGRFGPFLQVGGTYVSLKDDDDVLTIGLNRAVDLLGDKPRKDPPIELGKHPKSKKPLMVKDGRWGPFVQMGRTMARLPKDMAKEDVTLDIAIELIDAKSANGKGTTTKKAAAKKKPAAKKKTAAKKKAASKSKAETADADTNADD